MENDLRTVLTYVSLLLGLVLGWAALRWALRQRQVFTVFEWQRDLLYNNGRFVRLLEPGKHVVWGEGYTTETVDLRTTIQALGTQEVLTRDGLPVRLTATAEYAAADPRRFTEGVQSPYQAMYLVVQTALRDAVTALNADDLLARRVDLSAAVTEECRPRFEELGLRLDRIELRDITFPGELKRAFAAVLLAQKESQATLERARGESAALRSLANAARMLEGNPALAHLRLLQSLESAKGATIVLNATEGTVLPVGRAAEGDAKAASDETSPSP